MSDNLWSCPHQCDARTCPACLAKYGPMPARPDPRDAKIAVRPEAQVMTLTEFLDALDRKAARLHHRIQMDPAVVRALIACAEALKLIQAKVNEQAEDGGLWSVPMEGLQPIAEAYMQQELRRLHEVVESHDALARLAAIAKGGERG